MEHHAAACALRLPRARVHADVERRQGVRQADYLFELGRPLDVDVCLVQDSAEVTQINDVAQRIVGRLHALALPEGLSITLHVISVRDPDGGLALDAGAEAELVRAVECALEDELWRARPVHVTLYEDGQVGTDVRYRGRAEVLATAQLQQMKRRRTPTVVTYKGTLAELPEAERTYQAIRRKRQRGQRTGLRPWVLVLNTSTSMLLDLEEIRRGVDRHFGASETLSAVAVQRRALRSVGWGLTADDEWTAGFCSVVFENPRARHPLQPDELALFQERDVEAMPPAGVGVAASAT